MNSVIARRWFSIVLGRNLRSVLATLFVLGMSAAPIPGYTAPALDSAGARTDRTARMPGVSGPLVQMFEEQARTLRSLSWLASRHGLQASREGVMLDVVLRSDQAGSARAIEAVGGGVQSFSASNRRASVVVDNVVTLAGVAGLPMVQHVYPAYRPILRTGSVDSRAVQALQVDTVPGGLTGAGLKIGILSDSFARTSDVVDDDPSGVDGDGTTTTDGSDIDPDGNSTPVTLEGTNPQQSSDLPPTVELRRDDATGTLSDEGAAMAELVHDLAPGAEIAFYSAFVSFGEFAAGFDDLCNSAGVDVVVDDVVYINELMYQRDIISREAAECVDNGVPHFSSAGNNGDRAFNSVYRDFADNDNNDNGASTIFGNDFHDWNPEGGGDDLLRIRLDDGEGFTALLQWNQPALSTPENTSNGPRIDLDLYLFNGSGTILRQSRTDQQANDGSSGADPVETIQYQNSSGTSQNVFLGIDHWAGSRDGIPQDEGTDLEFRLVFFETGNPAYEYTPSASTMFGHAVADGVTSVGAVPWWETAAFDPTLGPTSTTDPESFTAKGGSLQEHFKPNGSFFRRTRAPQPSLAAVDGNNNTFFGDDISPIAGTEFDSDPNFFGTSAAASNAAAVAALLLEDDGSLTPEEIEAKLKTSAVDVTGQNAGVGCDDRTGAGLVDATAAVPAGDQAPRARAGDNQNTKSGRTVTLDGSTSTDNDGIERFRWTQVAGPEVSLSNPNGAQTSFTAPFGGGTLAFELRVTDAACLSDADRISVNVHKGGGGGGGSSGLLETAALLLSIFSRIGYLRMRSAGAT